LGKKTCGGRKIGRNGPNPFQNPKGKKKIRTAPEIDQDQSNSVRTGEDVNVESKKAALGP